MSQKSNFVQDYQEFDKEVKKLFPNMYREDVISLYRIYKRL